MEQLGEGCSRVTHPVEVLSFRVHSDNHDPQLLNSTDSRFVVMFLYWLIPMSYWKDHDEMTFGKATGLNGVIALT